MKSFATLPVAALLTLVNGTPTPTRAEKRADSCGQWDTVQTGSYTVYNNLWGQDAATSGGQCFGVDGLEGNTISWHASWDWVGGQGQVKSYPNVVVDNNNEQISSISAIPSTWSWTYTGDGMITDVAYDLFTSSTPGGSEEFEIMIWLGRFGGAGPISENYSAEGESVPVASGVQIAGHTWDLYKGPNGQMTVLSFVAPSNVQDFSGDLMDFFDFLVEDQGFDTSQYLKSAGAGSEPFEGTNAVFTTSAYSISIE